MQRWILLLCMCLALLLSACGKAPVISYAAIDGYDEQAGMTIDPINVWHDYIKRDYVVARVRHGERVGIVRREGNGVFIETASGVQGWVTYSFLKDLK